MTSQEMSRKFHESWGEIDKYESSKEKKHVFESVAGKEPMNSVTRGQLKSNISSNFVSETLVGSVAPSLDNKNCVMEGSCLPSCEKHEPHCCPSSKLTTDQTSDFSHGCTGDVLQKITGPVICSNLEMTSVATQDAYETDSEKFLNKSVVEHVKEHYVQALETKQYDTSCPKELVANSVEENSEKCASPRNNAERKSNDKKNLSSRQISKFLSARVESKSFQFSSESQRSPKLKYHNPKQFSRTSEKQSLTLVTGIFDISSGQSDLQKCRSSVSIKPVSQTTERCQSSELNTVKSDEDSASETSHSTTVQSLKNRFVYSDQCQTNKIIPEDVGNCFDSQNRRISGIRVKKKTSSTIQRLQEQILLQLEKDETKCNNSKVPPHLADEHHQDTKNDGCELNGKSNAAHTDRIQKQEKPYRQWHRMSRVLTAESKFIISPMLPNHVFSGTKENKLVPDQPEESFKHEETIDANMQTLIPVVSELVDVTSTCSCSSGELKTGDLCENTELEAVGVTIGEQATELPVCFGEAENDNKGSKLIDSKLTECGSESSVSEVILGAMSAEGTQNRTTVICNKWIKTEKNHTFTKETEMQQTKSFNETVFSVPQRPKSVVPQSIPRHKSLNLKELYWMKYHCFNELDEVCTSDHQNLDGDFISTDIVDKMAPLNSVSGVSQVTGPVFSKHKKEFIWEAPSKKVVNAGPKLRTATRSRNRGTLSSQMLSYNKTCLGSESQNVFSMEPRNAVKTVSRNSSKNSRHESPSFSSERKRANVGLSEQRVYANLSVARSRGATELDKDCLECVNKNWSSGCAVTCETQKEPLVTGTKTRKVFLADVASKLLQKVNRASFRVPWNESSEKYLEVQATQDYNGSLPGQLSFRKGQIIKQRSFINGPSDGMCYGYYRVGRLRKKKKGLFPSNFVTAETVEGMDTLDGVSLISSAKSAK